VESNLFSKTIDREVIFILFAVFKASYFAPFLKTEEESFRKKSEISFKM